MRFWCCSHFENVERFELYTARVIFEQDHDLLQVVRAADVSRHHCEVVSVQQQLAQKLKSALTGQTTGSKYHECSALGRQGYKKTYQKAK